MMYTPCLAKGLRQSLQPTNYLPRELLAYKQFTHTQICSFVSEGAKYISGSGNQLLTEVNIHVR